MITQWGNECIALSVLSVACVPTVFRFDVFMARVRFLAVAEYFMGFSSG